ncbi:hypothetical protein QR680_013278 [Steinernema hermaphroditum]|uniref:Reverse transcriptase domain-containing protein n=1 Tax=Steinernema hermaphroditum TaxID=289476 RepID=A0AA39I6Z6_9BILA|nr:hypothetical protein QR680_013278 [Steinernema hermaphroditum]
MIEELNEASLKCGLKMNKAKTKILATDETTIRLNGEEIKQVEAFIYLGQEVRLAESAADGACSGDTKSS